MISINDISNVFANRELNILVILTFLSSMFITRSANNDGVITNYTSNKAISER